jgi:RHH-type transcriptional regulator, proline utilization regulon repressor / proline dehydrogenase / delta 1-pyrroline-5-carboxylate dehydrogenase
MPDEDAVRRIGLELLAVARAIEQQAPVGERWLESLLERSLDSASFRIRALRFIDCLPALGDDEALVRHLHEYFDPGELPLPGLARWGLEHAGGRLTGGLLARSVRQAARLMARRFLGGADIDEALGTLERLQGEGAGVSLDRLGEAVVSEAEADAYLAAARAAVERLGDLAARRGWDIKPHSCSAGPLNLSVKVSSLYSQASARDLAGSTRAILRRLHPLALAARGRGVSLCLDMEHYDLKPVVLAVLQGLGTAAELRDWSGLGVALQAYLRDSEADLAGLGEWARARGTPLTVRLVRGAYWDQERVVATGHGWPLPVWSEKPQTDACWERCLGALLAARGALRPALATHNLRSLALAIAQAEAAGLGPEDYELQMLYGMGEALHRALLRQGRPLRVYLPYGELLPGMAYLVRRLLENSSSQSALRLAGLPAGPGEALLAPPAAAPQPPPAPSPAWRNEPLHRFVAEAERQGFAAALERVRGELGGHYPLRIGGRALDTGRTLASHNPAHSGQLIGTVAAAGAAEVDAAVAAATAAQAEWGALPGARRAELLRRAAALLRERRDQFAAWVLLEAGKPWVEADGDVCEAIDFLEYYAAQALRLEPGLALDAPGEANLYHYRPRGVGLVLPPWNFPLAILTGMLSATLVAGNCAILKPSSQTPVVAARLVDLLMEAGLPPEVVGFLPGPGAEVGEHLVRHPGVHLIAFTGSLAVGSRIHRLAAEPAPGQGHLKRVIAEMGGKNAIIVDADADLDDAVAGICASAFGYAGQKCSACARVIPVGDAAGRLLPRLLEAVASLPMGDPAAPGTLLGPVIEQAAQARIEAAVAEARGYATLALCRPFPPGAEGWSVGPAVFTDVPPDSPLAQEEIFGPVLAVLPARDLAEALAIANGTRYALTGGLYSRSPRHLERARREFRVGNLYLNRGITGALVGRQPFGGFALSGVGSKAGGPDYLLQFLEPRCVTESTLRRGLAPEG